MSQEGTEFPVTGEACKATLHSDLLQKTEKILTALNSQQRGYLHFCIHEAKCGRVEKDNGKWAVGSGRGGVKKIVSEKVLVWTDFPKSWV